MFELKVKTRFAGAHQLTMVGHKCENLHGHNWQVEVCVIGKELNSAGVLADFGDIKRAVRQVVDKELDHKFLNELDAFNNQLPNALPYILPKRSRLSLKTAWTKALSCPG